MRLLRQDGLQYHFALASRWSLLIFPHLLNYGRLSRKLWLIHLFLFFCDHHRFLHNRKKWRFGLFIFGSFLIGRLSRSLDRVCPFHYWMRMVFDSICNIVFWVLSWHWRYLNGRALPFTWLRGAWSVVVLWIWRRHLSFTFFFFLKLRSFLIRFLQLYILSGAILLFCRGCFGQSIFDHTEHVFQGRLFFHGWCIQSPHPTEWHCWLGIVRFLRTSSLN